MADFDPDAWLAENAEPEKPQEPAFDPNAWLAENAVQEQPPAKVEEPAFDPNAWLKENPDPQPQPTGISTLPPEQQKSIGLAPDRALSIVPKTTSYSDYVAKVRKGAQEGLPGYKERFDAILKAKETERQAGVAQGEADVTLQKTVPVQQQAQSTLAGATFGLSDMAMEKAKRSMGIEEGLNQKYTAYGSTADAIVNGLGTLAGGLLTGKAISDKIPKMSGLKGFILPTLGIATIQGVGNAISNLTLGRTDAKNAALDVGNNIVSALVGRVAGLKIPAGKLNAVGQVATDFVYDLVTDGVIRGRIKEKGFGEWLATEIPMVVASIVGAGTDYADPKFKQQQKQFNNELTNLVKSRAASISPEEMAREVETATLPREISPAPEKAGQVPAVEPATARPALPARAVEATVEQPIKDAGTTILQQGQERMTQEAILKRAGELGQEMADKRPYSEVYKEAKALGVAEGAKDKASVAQRVADKKAEAPPPPNPRENPVPETEFDPNVPRFSQRVAALHPETSEGISALDLQIAHLSNEQAVAQARSRINENPDAIMAEIRSGKGKDPIAFTAAQLMIDDAIKAGNNQRAVDLVQDLTPETTTVAQALHSLSLIGRLSPAGMVMKLQRDLNNAGAKAGAAKDIKGKLLDPKYNLTPDEVGRISNLMQDAQAAKEAGDGRNHDLNVARAMAIAADKLPAGFWKKTALVQTLAQLLNVKTIGRNIVGNTAFAGLDNVSKTFASFVDSIISKATGQRTTTMPSLREQLKGYKRGWKEAVEEIGEGIDTRKLGTQYDLPSSKVLTSRIGQLAEKTLGYALRVPDRAAYEAEVGDSLRRQMTAAKTTKATPEMIENAMYDGLYVTFQDNSVASKVFTGLKNLLNLNLPGLSHKDFGLGDLILKYPKTPANLLQRGIDYSPVGLFRGLFEIGSTLMGKPQNQYRAALDTSRGVVGTGMFMAAILLAKLGIISGSGEKDKDVEALERAQGRGRYRVNASALKRFILSGFNKDVVKPQNNDLHTTYDWAQPMALTTGGGATLGEASTRSRLNAGDMIGQVLAGLDESTKTLAEQPLLTGIKKVQSGESVVDSLSEVLATAPASFVPTILSQMTQYSDPVIKDARDRSSFNSMIKQFARKIPVLNKYLPNRIQSTGEKMEIKNPSLFNIFVNPAIATRYEKSLGAALVVDIFERGLGQNKEQFPRLVSDVFTIDGKHLTLTAEERNKLQEITGKEVMQSLDNLARSERAWTVAPEIIAKQIDQSILGPASSAAKDKMIKILGGMDAIKLRLKNTTESKR
jgi:hypothetical protein